jgi:hypothetical protein
MGASKKVRRWYEKHGIEYIPGDWGARSDTGETMSRDNTSSHYGGSKGHSRTQLVSSDAGMAWWWEKRSLPWLPRQWEDQEMVLALDEFFEPYISLLNHPKGNLLRQLINDRLTYEDIGENENISKQAAWKKLRSAVRDLTRLIAYDDPAFGPAEEGRRREDGRRRDYDAEREAAERVFDHYMARRLT